MHKTVLRSLLVPALLLASSALAAAAPAPAPGTAQGRGPTTPPHLSANTIIVFPFENNAMIGGRALADRLAAEVKAGLGGTYSVATFYSASPLLGRARGEGSLTREQIEGAVDVERGTVDPALAATVALRMGGRYALLGSIEAADVEAAQNRANVTVTVQLLDSATGAPARTAGVTGTFTGPQGAAQGALIEGAARDAAARALTELGVTPRPAPAVIQGGTAVPTAAPVREKRGASSYWLPLGLILGVLVAGVR